MKDLSSLDEEKKAREYDLSHARAEMEKLAIEIEMRKEKLLILDDKLEHAVKRSRAEMESLATEIEMRKEKLSILDEKLRRSDEN